MFRKTYQLTFVLILNALSSLAQSGLVFDRPAWDFGTIRETDGPVTHRFVCRNEGEHPEVILQVTTTCGCTTPRYTRKPILPGEEAEITARSMVFFASGDTSRPPTFVQSIQLS